MGDTDISPEPQSGPVRQKEELLSEALRIAGIGLWQLELPDRGMYWSAELFAILERDPHGLTPSHAAFVDAIHPQDRAQVEEARLDLARGASPCNMEYRLLMPDGRIRHVLEHSEACRDDAGNVIRCIGTVQDVSESRQAEKALQKANSEWNYAMEFFEDAIYLIDLDDRLVRANRTFYQLTGLTPEQAIGADITSIIHPQGEEVPCPVCRARRARRNALITMEADHPDNPSGRPIEVSVRIIRDEGDQPMSVLMGIHDLTRQREVENELRRHRDELDELVRERTQEVRLQAQIIGQVHDSIVTTDLGGRVTSWNRGAEAMFGYSAAEAKGRHISFVYPERKHDFLRAQVISPLLEKGKHDLEVLMHRRDASEFHAHLSLSMLYDDQGVPNGMVGYSLDISDSKRSEEALRRQAEVLASANRELEAFSYSVSHDLRAPLRAIDGFSELLLEDYADSLDDTGRDYLQRVQNGARRMAGLIDNLLDLSRVSRQELRRETVDLSALAHETLAKLAESGPERTVNVSIEPGLEVSGDRHLLEVLLDNLIGNAWKYTATRDHAEIAFGADRGSDDTVYYVRDNGVGFDMAHAGRLFGTFQRLHGGEFEGNGIGLATVQRIVKRHGGQVWGEAEKDRGATFYFTLPA